MKHIISMIVVAALAAVGMVEAKPEVRPEMPVRPVEMKVEGKKVKHHGQKKHHARPHGKRCHKHGVRPMPEFEAKRHGHKVMKHDTKKMVAHRGRKPMMDAPIVRPVRKHVMRKPEMNAFIVRPVRKACPAMKRCK